MASLLYQMGQFYIQRLRLEKARGIAEQAVEVGSGLGPLVETVSRLVAAELNIAPDEPLLRRQTYRAARLVRAAPAKCEYFPSAFRYD
jgi:hypothetical protein